jgi:hypothetical protein
VENIAKLRKEDWKQKFIVYHTQEFIVPEKQ